MVVGWQLATALQNMEADTSLTIRKFQSRLFIADDLVRIGTLTPGDLETVRHAIATRDNILISGGTGTGKTTLLNALAAVLPGEDWLILIEDTAELHVDAPNQLRFEARRAQGDLPAITIRDLLRASLRHWPDRLLVGEVRGRVSGRLAASPGAATEVVRVRRYDPAADRFDLEPLTRPSEAATERAEVHSP